MSAGAKKSETLEPTGSNALAALLSTPSLSAVRRAGPLIAEVDEQPAHTPTQIHTQTPTQARTAEEEGPTLLEQMMAEQRLATQTHRETQAQQQQKEAKKSFGGFKRGFFGSSSSAAAAPSKASAANNNNNNNSNNSSKSNSANSANTASSSSSSNKSEGIVEIKAKAREDEAQRERERGVVLEEVQTAMQEDNHPLLGQLRSNEWVTPDLTAALQTNPILSRGFRDPKCLAAVELMQKDPQAAKERFQRDAEVSLFLQEFGKVMSAHFEKLSLSQQQQQQKEIEPHKPIEEIGPLQAQALQKERGKEKVKESQNKTTKGKAATNEDADQARVQQILNDPELRELLMDADLQRILVECGDPVMLREHMKNPSTVRKIQKLQRAGLVQMQI